jgi:hypothetical protein
MAKGPFSREEKNGRLPGEKLRKGPAIKEVDAGICRIYSECCKLR